MIAELVHDGLATFMGQPPPGDDFWYTDSTSFLGRLLSAGHVPEHALQNTAVFACIRVLAETMSVLPLHLMRTDGTRREPAREHPLYHVLHTEPNAWQTPAEFMEMMTGHCALRGNAFARIVPGPRGSVSQLIPLHPARMEVMRLANNRLGYLYRPEGEPAQAYTQDEIFHLRTMSLDGMLGISVVGVNRRAVKLSDEIEGHGLTYFTNKATPGGILKMPVGQVLGDEAAAGLANSWQAANTGANRHKVAVLENGLEWQQIGLSNEDSQWLDTRRYQLGEVARMFRVPLPMINAALDKGSNTYVNLEQFNLSFVQHTMLSWITRWEQTITRDLVTEPKTYYPKFSVEGLLRGDTKSQAALFESFNRMGVLTINEIRALKDWDPVKGGDRRLVQANMVPLESVGTGIPGGANGEDGTLNAWVADAAERCAKAEIRELEKRADKAAEDRPRFDTWAREFWGGKQKEYVARTLGPIQGRDADAGPIAAKVMELCWTTIASLVESDPLATLARWRTNRTRELTTAFADILSITDDHENEDKDNE